MNRKSVAIAMIVLAAGVLGYWAIAGNGSMWTQTQVEEKVVDPDNPFADPNDPTAAEVSVWKDQFQPGLLSFVAPISGGLLLIAGLLFWSEARQRRKAAVQSTATDARAT